MYPEKKYYGIISLLVIIMCLTFCACQSAGKVNAEPNRSGQTTQHHPNLGILKGQVIDETTQEPVADALIQDGARTWIGFTDYNGEYEIVLINPGVYKVLVSHDRYAPQIKEGVEINAGQVTILDFDLNQDYPDFEQTEERSETGISRFQVLGQSRSAKKRQAVTHEALVEYSAPPTAISKSAMPAQGSSYDQMLGGAGVTGNFRSSYLGDFNTEQYDRIYDNTFLAASTTPLSTFSIDVDAASYSNIRRFINNGNLPPKDAVRIEEMINYFTYDYPQPTNKHPFSISTEIAPCPWQKQHQLVHIGLQGARYEQEDLPPSNLVFLLDVSGSMDSPNKLQLLKAAFRMLVGQLRHEDRVAIVVYAGNAGLVLTSTAGDEKVTILEALGRLQAGGSTAGGAGIQLAYKTAREHFIEGGNNRVILATDGDFNVGVSSDSELVRMIEEQRTSGIFLTVLGFGTGNYKDSKMEQLADKGNGNYAYIDNIQEARKVFVEELGATMFTIAKDVKIQVEFNPAQVQYYRLIGYENRMLNKEDFNDDAKDAGEIGAGHSVTALYEIIPPGVETDLPGVDQLKYQETKLSSSALESNELLMLKLRYKQPQSDRSQLITIAVKDEDFNRAELSGNFAFSAAVAEFGMLLRDSQFKQNSSFESVLELANKSKGPDEEGYRSEFIRLVKTSMLLAN